MAFKMNRPTIKGTALHKASIAKAKSESIVAPAEAGADATLVAAGNALGLSNVGKAIDFGIDSTKLKFKKKKEKEKKEKEKKEDTSEETIERDNRTDEQIVSLPTRGYVQPQKKEEELIKAQGEPGEPTVGNDKFLDAAAKAGIDINTLEDYEKAERTLVYDDKLDNWRERHGEGVPEVPVAAGFLSDEGEVEPTDIFADKTKAGGIFQVSGDDMVDDGKGGYAPKEGATSLYGDTWDAKAGGWRNNAKEKYYGPEGQKIFKEQADKLSAQQHRKAEKALKIQNLAAAKEYYGPGVSVGKTAMNEYEKLLYDENGRRRTNKQIKDYKENLENPPLEIEEINDPELGDAKYDEFIEKQKQEEFVRKDDNNNKIPDYLEREPEVVPVAEENIATEKPKQSDFRDKKNSFGGLVTAADQQKKALKEWYSAGNADSPLDKRDDRIWNGAIKSGKVHENMRKSGYIPHNER
jgi:hypothetical protein